VAFLLLASSAVAAAPLRVGIRDGYLKGMGRPDVWSAARDAGIDRLEVEVTPELECKNLHEADGSRHSLADQAGRDRLRRALAQHHMSISAFTTVIPLLGKLDPPAVQRWVDAVAAAAGPLGVKTIMVVPTAKDIPDQEFLRKAAEHLKPLEAIAARRGVVLAIENLGLYLNRPEILEPILGWFNPARVGLALDICNMYWYGHPLSRIYELAQRFAPRVRYVHVKNVKYPADRRESARQPGWEYKTYAEPVASGDLDFRRLLAIYHRAGFRGDVTLEDDSLPKYQGPALTEIHRQDARFLREAIGTLTPRSGRRPSPR
jgi:sugar phosphate isomerase/epimerase